MYFVAGKPAVQSMLVTKPGWNILLEKGSTDAKVTASNAQYSLAEAVYGIYKGEALVARITTDADGHGTTDTRLPDGVYTVREMEAPAGYALSDEAKIVVIDGADAFVDAEDAPVTVRLVLVKKDSETGEAAPQGAASLDGAEYEATYAYDGGTRTVKGTTEGAPGMAALPSMRWLILMSCTVNTNESTPQPMGRLMTRLWSKPEVGCQHP